MSNIKSLLDGEGRLPPGRRLGDFYLGYPFHPFEAAPAGGYEANGETVAMGQKLAGDVGSQDETLGVMKRETPVIASD